MSVHVFLSSQNITRVFAYSFSWATSIYLNLTLVSLARILCITGTTKGSLFDLTLGFHHSSRSLRSTYLGCSFNFFLLHVTVIFGGSFAKICCILVAGLKPAPWMFLQFVRVVKLFSYWSTDISRNLLISDFEIRAGFVQSAFHTIAQKTYLLNV